MGYRAAKFVRRHLARRGRGAVADAGAGRRWSAFYTVQLAAERDRARLQAEKAAKRQRAADQRADERRSVSRPRRLTEPTRPQPARYAADAHRSELGDQPELQAEMFTVIGRTYERLGMHRQGAAAAREGARDRPPRARLASTSRVAQSLNDLGVLQRRARQPRGRGTAADPKAWRCGAGCSDRSTRTSAVTLVELGARAEGSRAGWPNPRRRRGRRSPFARAVLRRRAPRDRNEQE